MVKELSKLLVSIKSIKDGETSTQLEDNSWINGLMNTSE